MSSGGGGQQSTTQQTILPDWLQAGTSQSIANAENLSTTPYQANPDLAITPVSGDTTAAYDTIRTMQGGTAGAYGAAETAAGGLLAGATPLTAEGIGADATSLMNPYTAAVVDPSVALLRQQTDQGINTARANASNVGAFGGSRLGAVEGNAYAQEGLNAGQLAGGLLQSGYGQALSTATDIGKTNLAAGEFGINALPGLATAGAGQTIKEAAALEGVGDAETARTQAEQDFMAQQWQEQHDYPLQQQAILEQALTSTPYGGTAINTGPKPAGPNKALTALGGAASGAALGTMIYPGIGTAVGAVAGGLLGAFG